MNDSAICVVFGNSGPSGLCSVFILNSKIAGPCVFDPISPCSCFVMKLYSISVHIIWYLYCAYSHDDNDNHNDDNGDDEDEDDEKEQ